MSALLMTHLLFPNRAEEAMDTYASLFDDARVLSRQHYPDGEHSGRLMLGRMRIGTQLYQFADSPVPNDFSMTPSASVFVECSSIDEMDRVFEVLGDEGQILMPLKDYGFSRKFVWLVDRFGLSWQLNLPHAKEVEQ